MTAHTFTRHDVSFASGDAACAAWLYLPDGSSGSTSAGARVDTASSSPGNVIVDLTQLGEPDNIVIEDDRDLAGLSLGQGHQGGNRRGTRPQLAHRPTAPARRRPGPRPRPRASRHHGRDAAPQRSRGPAEAWGKRQRRVDHHEGPRETPRRRLADMKAFVVEKYGKGGLRAARVPEPTVGSRDVLVRVSAASINPLDKMVRNGEFKQLIKYKTPFVLGHDVAGVVTRVGADVRDFKVGDEVYARPRDLRIGTFAEYIAIDQADLAVKPSSLTMEEAAAVPLVALAASQALVDLAQVKPGQKILVHAGAGGLGSTVVQLAKHLGGHV